jgi:hypothetical protein
MKTLHISREQAVLEVAWAIWTGEMTAYRNDGGQPGGLIVPRTTTRQ